MSDPKERIGIIDVGALMRWVRSTAGRTYRVRFDASAETACVTAEGEMIIPTPNSTMTKRDAVRLRGWCLHETSHPRYQPRVFEVMQENRLPARHPLQGIYNLFLDVHCETMRANEWSGDAKALSEFGAVIGHDITERLEPKLKVPEDFSDEFTKMAAVLTTCRNAEGAWNIGYMVGFDKLINTIYTQEIRDIAEAIETKFSVRDKLVDKCDEQDEYSIWDLSKEVFNYLYPDKDADEEVEKQKPKAGKGEPEKGEPEEGEGAKSGAPKPEQGKDGEEVPATKQEEKIKIEELLFSDHYETMAGSGSGVGFDYANHREYRTYTPVDPEMIIVTKYSKGEKARRY